MNNRIWKLATLLVFLLIILNPEMIELALFVDAIGLELFLMLVEVQIMAIVALFLSSTLKPLHIYAKHFWFPQPCNIHWLCLKTLLLAVYGPVILMNVLVLAAAIGILSTAY